MEENIPEITAERKDETLVPRELFFRVLHEDPEVEVKWDRLQPYLQDLYDVDGGVTIAHSKGVERLSGNFFGYINNHEHGLSVFMNVGQFMDTLKLGALLHDIGKAARVDGAYKYQEILKSDQVLTPEQRELINQHSQDGAQILHEIGLPDEIIRIARDHHKKGDRQVLDLRTEIITLADVLEARTSSRRAYNKNPLDKFEAFGFVYKQILNRLAGTRIKELFKDWEPVYEGVPPKAA